MSHCSSAHAKLIFSKNVTVLDAIVAVLLMEASLNGCGKLLDKINALHTTFAAQPEQEYEDHGACPSFVLTGDFLRINYTPLTRFTLSSLFQFAWFWIGSTCLTCEISSWHVLPANTTELPRGLRTTNMRKGRYHVTWKNHRHLRPNHH